MNGSGRMIGEISTGSVGSAKIREAGNALPAYVAEFAEEFQRIIQEKNTSGKSGKEFLETLSTNELYAIQKSKLLVSQIRPETLSEEGAENLFVKMGDDRKYVDLNNDGITEIGVGKILIFPPPNTSDKVKDAWDKTSKNMSFSDKMMVMGSFLAQRIVDEKNNEETKGSYAKTDDEFLSLIGEIKSRLIENNKMESVEAFKKNREMIIEALSEFEKNIRNPV